MPGLDTALHAGADVTALWSRGTVNPWTPAWLQARGLPFWLAANAVAALAYAVLGAVVGQFFGAYGLFPAPIWLPAGIACVASMIGGAGLLPGIFLGSLTVNWLLFGSPFLVAAAISLTNTIGPWAGAMVTRCFRPPSGLFTRFTGVFGFIVGAVLLHAAITGAGGMLALMLHRPMPAEEAYHTFATWWLCDSGGTFFFAPALLLWLGAERTPRTVNQTPTWLDLLVLLGTLSAAVLLFVVPALGRLVRPDAVFLLTVPLSWITLRISLRAAYTLLTLICVTATVGTVIGHGPFHGSGVANPLQSVGLMTVLFAMDALTLIALTSERREAELRLAETRGTLAQVAEQSEQLRHEALTDPLTQIGNRRLFMTSAAAALERSRRAGQDFALILLDLDHFKRVNDSGGHATGDAALHSVARTLAVQTRSMDILARIGGEEFAIALPGATLAEAADVAKRLRQQIARLLPRGPNGRPIRLTASFGVTLRHDADRGIEDMLRRADAAVYAAKTQGRNRVETVTRPGLAG